MVVLSPPSSPELSIFPTEDTDSPSPNPLCLCGSDGPRDLVDVESHGIRPLVTGLSHSQNVLPVHSCHSRCHDSLLVRLSDTWLCDGPYFVYPRVGQWAFALLDLAIVHDVL